MVLYIDLKHQGGGKTANLVPRQIYLFHLLFDIIGKLLYLDKIHCFSLIVKAFCNIAMKHVFRAFNQAIYNS